MPACSRSDLPLVSIVTPSFNQGEFLGRTIQSVMSQDYPRIQYIVVDGKSTDNTSALLNIYTGQIQVICEPDNGQADAINKGFRLATGQIFGWLNSDDWYLSGTIAAVVRYFHEHPEVDFVYGDALAIDSHDRTYGIRSHVRQTDFRDLAANGDFIVQPAAFWRASLWHQIGELDVALQYVLDYEYWLRASQVTALRYLPVCLSAERLHTGAKTARGWQGRTMEIQALADRYGWKELPVGFRGQIAAERASHGLHRLVRLDGSGIQDLRAARQIHPPLGVFWKYLCIMLIFGEPAVARFWLLMNLTRQHQKAQVITPRDYLGMPGS